MNPVTIVLLVILVVLIGAAIGLYFWGKKAQKKQEEQQAQIEAAKQTVSMLVIDKKRLPLKESGLPQMVIDQAPKLMRRTKLPIVKAKIGPRISILIADEKVFETILLFPCIPCQMQCIGERAMTPQISGINEAQSKASSAPFEIPYIKIFSYLLFLSHKIAFSNGI